MYLRAFGLCLVIYGFAAVIQAQESRFEFRPGDSVCILGNTLAERMQHDGWLEAYLHAQMPDHQLRIRNLGFSADTIKVRLRSSGFGSPDDHLSRNRADVVFMMFGYGESFDGLDGVGRFEADYDAEVKRMLQQEYNGKSPPRIVLFSPIAHEDLHDPNLPDGSENNRRLESYSEAIRNVAQANGIAFVDLFHPTRDGYRTAQTCWTINGVHLNEAGNQAVARIILDSLVGRSQPPAVERLEAIRAAVLDKNFFWFQYYRTTDGYSIFGGRADLEFVDRQTNRAVMHREMEILEAMIANRDPKIWAAAQGKEYQVDDSNTPPFISVVSNIPGNLPDGTHRFLGGNEAIGKMRLLDGFEISLFASEELFPELANPVQMSFDTKGRLWVAVWPSYPHWKPKDEMNDKLLILEDTDGNGLADKCTTFADQLHNPTGFEFWGGGVFVAQVPDVVYFKDTDGDDRADVRERKLHGLDSADTHHSANSFTFGPDGALYMQEGTFHRTQVESPYGVCRSVDAGSYRFEPRTGKFETYTAYGYANPHGHVFDQFGQDILHDGTGSDPYDAALISGRIDFPNKHGGAPMVYSRRTRPCPATEFVSAMNFPTEMQGELLVENVIGDLGVLRYKIDEAGSSFSGRELPPLLLSDDPNFRPVDLEFGPDGLLYVLDWQNPIIGHMQHNLRDPNRDHAHGRVYRIKYKANPVAEVVPENQLTIDQLVDRLLTADPRTRYRIRIELSSRPSQEVIESAAKRLVGLQLGNPLDCQKLLEILWLHEQHHFVNRDILLAALTCADHRVRGAAVRTLTNWLDELPDGAEMLLASANDSHPRVRMLAARGASYLAGSNGLPIVATVAGQDVDRYTDYVIRETMRQVNPGWKSLVGEMKWLADVNRRSRSFVLDRLSPAELAKLPMSEDLADYLVTRSGIDEQMRKAAVEKLAEEREVTPTRVLVALLSDIESASGERSVLFDLIRLLAEQPPKELALQRGRMESFAVNSPIPALRQVGLVGMMLADQGIDATWEFARHNASRLVDLCRAMPILPDPKLQHALFPRIFPLINELPADVQNEVIADRQSGKAKFVRIELPGNGRILTLAEVEVVSNGINVARRGSATQSSTAHDGDAKRAIDGNTDGRYAAGGQTHTVETTNDPWWEVELAENCDIESVRVFNRTEENFAMRLDGFTIRVLAADRSTLFVQTDLPAPSDSNEIDVDIADLGETLRRSAISAVVQVRGKEADVFNHLAKMIASEDQADAAVRAIQSLPVQTWNADSARQMARAVVDRIEATPPTQRASEVMADWMQLGETIASILSPEEASKLREQLGQLGIRILRLGVKPHRMAFDKTKLIVRPNKPLVLILENTDMMPHNWVLVDPGALEEVGLQAESESQRPDALSQHYVPKNSRVLVSSRLVQPQQTQRINLTTPSKPGVYPFVCTYPGHWRRMFGAMFVVDSPERFQANPEGYLAEAQLQIRDPLLLTINRATKEWKIGELSNEIDAGFVNGRDFANGQQMFTVASCVSCHKFGGQGHELGSDLTKLDPQWTPEDVLNHILEPSMKIDEKYKTQIFQLVSGNTVSGVVVSEDDTTVRIVENPLVQANTTSIPKNDIDDRKASNVSIMPKGLLDTLTRDEIFDLLGYVISRGEESHPLYGGK